MPVPFYVSSAVDTAARSASKAALAINVVNGQPIEPSTINNAIIGGTDPAAASFTTVESSGAASFATLNAVGATALKNTTWGASSTFTYGAGSAAAHLTALGAASTTALTSETSAREAADLTLTSNLNTEASARAAADATKAPKAIASIAVLKAVNVASYSTGDALNLLGYYTAGDGGGGAFRYDSLSSATDNGGTVIAPTSGSGRWLRVFSGQINVLWFGAKGDGVTNNTTAFHAAIAAAIGDASAPGGGHVHVPHGIYKANIVINHAGGEAIRISGDGAYMTSLRPFNEAASVLKHTGYFLALEGVEIRGNNSSTWAGTGLELGDGALHTSSAHIYVRDFNIRFLEYGMLINGMLFGDIQNGDIASCTWGTKYLGRTQVGEGNALSLNTFRRVQWQLCTTGLHAEGGYLVNLKFENCDWENNTGQACYFKQTTTLDGNPFVNITFDNCFWEFNHTTAGDTLCYDVVFDTALTANSADKVYTASFRGCWYNPNYTSNRFLNIKQDGRYGIYDCTFRKSGAVVVVDHVYAHINTTHSISLFTLTAPGTYATINVLDTDGVAMGPAGTLQWATAAGVVDTEISRAAAGVVGVVNARASGNWSVASALSSDAAYYAGVTGDSHNRFEILASGRMFWGPGSASRTTSLNWVAPESLQLTSGFFDSLRAGSTSRSFAASVSGDATYRLDINASGKISWANGANPADISLSRSGVGSLIFDSPGGTGATGSLIFSGSAATTAALLSRVSGDAQNRLAIFPSGKIEIGSGSATRDVVLERTTAAVLRLTGSLEVGTAAEHADNAAAVTAGLAVGRLYRTGDVVKIVH